MTNDSRSTLHEITVNLVHRKSGGEKMTALITDVVQVLFERQLGEIVNEPDFIDEFERVIRQSPVLKILDYISHEHNRVKMFVYTP